MIPTNGMFGAQNMNHVAGNERAYAESGPWDKIGMMLRISVAVVFLAITVVFVATARDGLVSADGAARKPVANATRN